DGLAARLDEGEGAAVHADDVGVDDLALVALHPPVAVPLGPPVAQADAVDHAVADEPVVAGGVGGGAGVGADADEAPGQLVGDRAGHLQLGDRDLLGHRRVVAVEPGRRGLHRCSSRGGRSVGRSGTGGVSTPSVTRFDRAISRSVSSWPTTAGRPPCSASSAMPWTWAHRTAATSSGRSPAIHPVAWASVTRSTSCWNEA